MTWLLDLLRSLLFFIDELVYGLIGKIYNLFLEIANTTIFTDAMIEEFAGKVYALVGIFMLFKVSFSILTYIVNPDEFADKNKGMGKLVQNILTSLIMLIAVPFVFEQAMDIQRIILKDNVIPKIFSTKTVTVDTLNPNVGSDIAQLTFSAFYDPPGEYTTIEQLFNTDVNEKDSYNNYRTNYDFLISTVVGVVIVLLLISFCFDVAVRSIKLGFLRLLAPVPIITRVDPKKGNDLFNKWTKNCINTYLDIFTRLIAIYFAIYIISALSQSIKEESLFVDAVTNNPTKPNGFTIVFIILGALLFAKQLPKLIEDLLGIKLSGTFSLNPAKKLADVPIAGKLSAATIGAVDSKLHGNGFRAGWKRNWNNVSWQGDSKNSVFQTADRKLRREVNEKRDNARMKYEGKKEFDEIDEKWKAGEKIYRILINKGVVPGDAFDGITRSNYKVVFQHEEFINSKMKLDAQDTKVKEITSAYEAYKLGSNVTINGRTYVAGNATDASDLYQELDKANKSKSGLEKVHETMRKQYKDDAEREDQHKFRKYNPTNPTA